MNTINRSHAFRVRVPVVGFASWLPHPCGLEGCGVSAASPGPVRPWLSGAKRNLCATEITENNEVELVETFRGAEQDTIESREDNRHSRKPQGCSTPQFLSALQLLLLAVADSGHGVQGDPVLFQMNK
jgi:hypothetical protein